MSYEPTPVPSEDTPQARASWLVPCPGCGNLTAVRASLCTRCGRDNPGRNPVRIRRHDEHVHRRDWRPCPATMPPPLRPTKPASTWLFAYSSAILFEETFAAFVAAWPEQFPAVAS